MYFLPGTVYGAVSVEAGFRASGNVVLAVVYDVQIAEPLGILVIFGVRESARGSVRSFLKLSPRPCRWRCRWRLIDAFFAVVFVFVHLSPGYGMSGLASTTVRRLFRLGTGRLTSLRLLT